VTRKPSDGTFWDDVNGPMVDIARLLTANSVPVVLKMDPLIRVYNEEAATNRSFPYIRPEMEELRHNLGNFQRHWASYGTPKYKLSIGDGSIALMLALAEDYLKFY
jgi:hypothetical protein